MIFKIVNPATLVIESSYEADGVIQYGGPFGQYTHVFMPEGLDPDCVKAELVEDVITLVEDTDKTAAKALATKVAQCDALEAQLWVDILAEMADVYGTTDMNSATAYYLTWRRMSESPATFVGDLFVDQAAVTAYCTPKLSDADAFAVWRLEKIVTCNAAKAAIMAG
jgi:hypothetical protein